MKLGALVLIVMCTACGSMPEAGRGTTVVPPSDVPAAAPPQVQAGIPAAGQRLSDLEAMTFDCPRAGLNAAAREAAKVSSQGSYQFSYFRIVGDSHHSAYEVHFKSNYHGEPDLKYCVSVYCQQGWDPKTSKPSVRFIGHGPRATGAGAMGAAHGADCGDQQTRMKRRSKR